MDDRHDPNLILGYIEGDLDADAAARVEGYMAEDAKLAALVADLQTQRAALRAADPPPAPAPGTLADAAMATLEREMLLEGTDEVDATPSLGSAQSTTARRFRGWLAYGGMAAVLAIAAAVVLQTLRSEPMPDRTVAMSDEAERYDFAEAPIRAQREAIAQNDAAVWGGVSPTPQDEGVSPPTGERAVGAAVAEVDRRRPEDPFTRDRLASDFADATPAAAPPTATPTVASGSESEAAMSETAIPSAPAAAEAVAAFDEVREAVADLDAMPLRRALRAGSLLAIRPTRARAPETNPVELGRLDVASRAAERSWRLYFSDTPPIAAPTKRP
ncbi:MAG: hypothetical protein AAFX76_12575 [Planctomycetota bacterium]